MQFNVKKYYIMLEKYRIVLQKKLAYKEYDKFKVKQDKLYKSDFDNFFNEAIIIEKSENNE